MKIHSRAHATSLLCGLLFAATAVALPAQQPPSAAPGAAAERQLRQAATLADHNDPQGALTLVDQLLAQNPRFADALKLKAMLFEDAGRKSEAATLYEQALQLAPNDPDLLLKLGMFQLAAGNRDEAIRLLEHCVRVAPKDGDAQFYLAQAWRLNGETDRALAAMRASATLEPANPDILQKYGEYLLSAEKYPDALDYLTRAQKANPQQPGIDYDLGAASYKLMDLATAQTSLTRALAAQPGDANALALLGTVQIHLAQWQDASANLQRALALNPGDTGAQLGLGHCQVELHDDAAAIDTLHRVLHADPTQLQAHFYLARAYAALGQAAEAQHEAALHHLMMQQFTFMPSEAKDAAENAIIPQARALLAAHKEAEVLRLYQLHFSGSAATPADAWVFAGKLYLTNNDRANGLRCLHQALAIDPQARGAHTAEGFLALHDNDLPAAESAFQAELAHDPNAQAALAGMGELRYRQARYADAAQLLAQSKTRSPQQLYMLCDADFRQHDIPNANLTAELTEAYGRADAALMQNLIALLRANAQTPLADRLTQDMQP